MATIEPQVEAHARLRQRPCDEESRDREQLPRHPRRQAVHYGSPCAAFQSAASSARPGPVSPCHAFRAWRRRDTALASVAKAGRRRSGRRRSADEIAPRVAYCKPVNPAAVLAASHRVVLLPVAAPAAPVLDDPPLGDVGRELAHVVRDLDLGQVVRLPTCPAEPPAEVRLLRVDEEALVEAARPRREPRV